LSEITDEFIVDARERMAKSVESCKHELATVRTGRAPTTSTLAGGTLPAAVTWPVKSEPNSWAASMTAR
jgi:hypothetical protein